MKILIVGAGIGGLTLAGFLKDTYIGYDIVEKSSDWNHQGYSLCTWNNARNILQKLGLAEIFDEKATRIQNYDIRDGKGTLIRRYNMSEFYSSYGMAMSMITRADLHDWLMGKVGQSKITMNMSVEHIDQKDDKVIVRFTDGNIKEYDVVIGADGIHSKVRNQIFQKDIVKINPWRVWYMWIDNRFKTKATASEYIEPGEFVSIFDNGEKTMASIVATSDNSVWDEQEGRIERLKKLFKHQTALIPGLFESLKDEDINPTDLIHITMNTWVKNRVVVIGDAAHGFEPYAGIGASMAMEDGYVLASELLSVSDIPTALKKYEKRRRKRVQAAFILTQKMKRLVVIKSPWLRKIANQFISILPSKLLVRRYHKLMSEEA